MADNNNPIAFNPDTMTVSQLKECAETLSTLIHSVNRGNPAEDIVLYIEQARDHMNKKWHGRGKADA